MALKTEMWAAFEHFDVSPLDHTFKRNPGLYFRSCNAEETPLPARPSGRVHSHPPAHSESAWIFHQRCAPLNEQRQGPMLRCRSAEECSYDEVTASLACDLFKCTGYGARPVSKRGIGQFSSEGSALAQKLVIGDLHSRGICDIDRNSKRGAGFERRACATTFGNEQEFSEEHHAELKRNLAKLTQRHTLQAVPEFLHDLAGLGVECRRLQASSVYQQREMSEEERRDARAGSKKFSPVLDHDNSSKAKQRSSAKEDKAKWVDEASSLNVNTQRLTAMSARRGVLQGKLPKHAQSKSLKRLVAETLEKKHDAESQAETCSTCDEAPTDEMIFQLDVQAFDPSIPSPLALPWTLRDLQARFVKLESREERLLNSSTCADGSDYTESPPSSPRSRASTSQNAWQSCQHSHDRGCLGMSVAS